MPKQVILNLKHRSRLRWNCKPSSITEQHCIGRGNWQTRSAAIWKSCSDNQINLCAAFIGVIARRTRRTERAVELIKRAIGLKPKVAEAHNNRGNALMDLKRPAEALASCDKAIALKPHIAESHYNRGKALKDLKRPEDAIASYDKAIALKPNSPGHTTTAGMR